MTDTKSNNSHKSNMIHDFNDSNLNNENIFKISNILKETNDINHIKIANIYNSAFLFGFYKYDYMSDTKLIINNEIYNIHMSIIKNKSDYLSDIKNNNDKTINILNNNIFISKERIEVVLKYLYDDIYNENNLDNYLDDYIISKKLKIIDLTKIILDKIENYCNNKDKDTFSKIYDFVYKTDDFDIIDYMHNEKFICLDYDDSLCVLKEKSNIFLIYNHYDVLVDSKDRYLYGDQDIYYYINNGKFYDDKSDASFNDFHDFVAFKIKDYSKGKFLHKEKKLYKKYYTEFIQYLYQISLDNLNVLKMLDELENKNLFNLLCELYKLDICNTKIPYNIFKIVNDEKLLKYVNIPDKITYEYLLNNSKNKEIIENKKYVGYTDITFNDFKKKYNL